MFLTSKIKLYPCGKMFTDLLRYQSANYFFKITNFLAKSARMSIWKACSNTRSYQKLQHATKCIHKAKTLCENIKNHISCMPRMNISFFYFKIMGLYSCNAVDRKTPAIAEAGSAQAAKMLQNILYCNKNAIISFWNS